MQHRGEPGVSRDGAQTGNGNPWDCRLLTNGQLNNNSTLHKTGLEGNKKRNKYLTYIKLTTEHICRPLMKHGAKTSLQTYKNVSSSICSEGRRKKMSEFFRQKAADNWLYFPLFPLTTSHSSKRQRTPRRCAFNGIIYCTNYIFI